MKEFAVVPVKGFSDAKKRLAHYLGPSERKRLVEAMLLDVLNALSRSRIFNEIMVISPDSSVEDVAHENDAVFVRQNGTGLNSAVRQATNAVLQREVHSLTTVLADIPLLEPRDLEELMRISRHSPRVVLVPSSKGGTNIILRAPPNIMNCSYGRWSYGKHLRSAQNIGIPTYSISNQRLSLDVDNIDDLRTLRHVDASASTNAGRLARELGRLYPLARNQ